MGFVVAITLLGAALVAAMLALFMPGTPELPMLGDSDGPRLILMFLGAAWSVLGAVQYLRFGRSKLSKLLISLLALMTLAGTAAGAWWVTKASYDLPEAPQTAIDDEIPAFEAVDQEGREVSSESLRGKPFVMIFARGVW